MNEKLGFGYYVVVPMKLLMDKRLSANAKLTFGVIANLSNDRGYCFASNEYIGKIIDVHEMTISRYIHELIENEYILRFDEVTNGGKQRRLYLNNSAEGGSTETLRGGKQNCLEGVSKIAYHNNISLILKDEYSKKNNKNEVFEILEFEDQESNDAWNEWLNYRRQMRKPVKGITKDKQLRFLRNLDAPMRVATINQSITQGWTGLFEVKNVKKTPKNEYSADLLSAIGKLGK